MLLVAEPSLGKEEKAALDDVIRSGWITMGERVRAFEEAFAAAHAVPDVVALGSCTAALHLILAALDVGPGDEVLVPSLTFVATANAVLYTGATPVFCDIESLQSPLLSLQDAAAKITTKTKAIIFVHYAGYLANRKAWQALASRHGLLLIEDAAHAAGAEGAGTIGDAAAFSFYGNKNMTTAEGGAVTARRPELLAKIRQMRGHGMTSGTFQRLTSKSSTYDVTMLGFNYRMDELRAAIGIVQLQHLAQWNLIRKSLSERYHQVLHEQCPSVVLPFTANSESGDHITSHHIMPVLLPEGADRQDISGKLRDAEIQTTMHYPPVHSLSYYRERFPAVSLPLTEQYARRELTLPLHPKMQPKHVQLVADALAKALTN